MKALEEQQHILYTIESQTMLKTKEHTKHIIVYIIDCSINKLDF
jgi:hypothetical protein